MERLLLVSMFQNVTGLLKEIEPDLEGKTVTYIPTASRVERLGFLARMSRWVLRGMGLRVDAVDVSTAPYEAMRRAFEGNDLVFIVGGNTFCCCGNCGNLGRTSCSAKRCAQASSASANRREPS